MLFSVFAWGEAGDFFEDADVVLGGIESAGFGYGLLVIGCCPQEFFAFRDAETIQVIGEVNVEVCFIYLAEIAGIDANGLCYRVERQVGIHIIFFDDRLGRSNIWVLLFL